MKEHQDKIGELEIIQQHFNAFSDSHESTGGSLLAPGWPIMQFILGLTVGHV